MALRQSIYAFRTIGRGYTTESNTVRPLFTNRNPRNLEKLRIGYKPDGYHVDKKGKSFWHKLILTDSARNVTATVRHYRNGNVISASTQEWAIRRHLYSATDLSAYINVGRVLAERCMQFGITEIYCDIEPITENGKVAEFLRSLESSGLKLTEPPQYKTPYPWDQTRPEKPWDVTE